MNTRFLLVGTIVGALALFGWQTLSNTLLPWHMATMRTFPNDSASAASVEAIRAVAQENGVYVSTRGVLAAVSLRADFTDKSRDMGGMIARQLLLDLAAAFVFCLVVMRLPTVGALAIGVTLGLGALAISGIQSFSDSIWYGFTYPYSFVNMIDSAIGATIAGLVLGTLLNRSRAKDSGVKAHGGVGMGAREGARMG
jgi:hypothetical protein